MGRAKFLEDLLLIWLPLTIRMIQGVVPFLYALSVGSTKVTKTHEVSKHWELLRIAKSCRIHCLV